MDGLGVSVHALTSDDVGRIKALGARYIRTDLRWNHIEQTHGQYDWSEADKRIAMISSAGIRPVLILDYSNPNYEPPAAVNTAQPSWLPPTTESARNGFATWAAAAAGRYAASRPIWEIWNEPEGDGSWPPHADVTQYLNLAETSCAAIRKVDPRASIWGPALGRAHNSSAISSPFLKTLLVSPLDDCLSAISIHSYISWSEIDESQNFWRAVRSLPARAQKPFANSESGLPSGFWGVTDQTQASYLIRMLIHDHMSGTIATIWYDWRDDGRTPTNREHHFGLMDADGKAKPAFVALTNFVEQTRNLNRQCFLNMGGVILLQAWNTRQPQRILLMAWTPARHFSTNPIGDIDIPLSDSEAKNLSAKDLFGQPVAIKFLRDASSTLPRVHLSNGAMPYYLRYNGNAIQGCN